MRDGSVAVEGLDEPPRRLDGRADRADLVVAVGGLGVATPAVRGPRGCPDGGGSHDRIAC
jgi:hypothetical protein